MSKADNLKDFLIDVADAIRLKKGSTELINPQDFSSEIASLSGSGGLEIVDMTETTATIEPNKVYVWGMVESLDITLGASTDESDFFAFRFRCSKPIMTSVTVNGATWADDTELDAQGKPILDLGSWYQCEIKGGTSVLYARLAHYIHFADPKVEAVLLAKGIGDGLGVTYKDAAKVTDISTWFKRNEDITSFAEFINFSGITQLINEAFISCYSLAEINLPDTLTSIGNSAFEGCKSLVEITLPASLTSIGYYVFQGCSSLTRVINLENIKVTSILVQTFRGCSSLAEINLPDTLTSIGNGAFRDCSSLAEINLPDTLTSIGYYVFQGCSLLARVINLENTQLTSISSELFLYCSSLAEINLPAGVTSIGDRVFYGCSSLRYIVVKATTPPTLSSTNAIPSTIGAIYVPDESVAAYQSATNWSSFASKIKGISEMPAE